MANVSSSNGLEKRPKLRFPGFDEPWRAERLSDFADRITRKNSKNETDLPLTISSKDGLVDQVSYFNKTVASKDMSGYYLLKNGEFAYNKSYSVGYDFGSIKRLDRYRMGALSTLYICFVLKRHESDFIKAYFDSLKWYREIYMISAEGARNHGLLNVPTEEFFDTKHYLPENTDEQRKIANFLIAIDKRIAAQQSLIDNLKKYKRGVTRRLFAQEKGSFETNLQIVVADGLFCREIDGLFCRSSPDIIVRRRCVLSHKRRGWLQPSPSFRYSRNLALQDELYHPVINNGPAVLVCVDKRLGTGPVNQSRDAG